eukprot:TRINITY_DN21243_c0_g1_i5.p1 TRINITY_DN21243_c0_g1~~TRINITY_DN21243_c0_g1_i5.p1  ORF type:complete len:114 (-),score=0.83 TRINITY_DN21243_c0_g1_i5:320-661(-)
MRQIRRCASCKTPRRCLRVFVRTPTQPRRLRILSRATQPWRVALLHRLGRETASLWVYLGTLTWAIVMIVWLWVYIFRVQHVLPGYRWDISAVCRKWHESLLDAPTWTGSVTR